MKTTTKPAPALTLRKHTVRALRVTSGIQAGSVAIEHIKLENAAAP